MPLMESKSMQKIVIILQAPPLVNRKAESEKLKEEIDMHAMWVFLKNGKCGSKLNDVVSWSRGSCSTENGCLHCERVHGSATPPRQVIFRPNCGGTLLCGLDTGDPSRKIVEMIFQRASRNPSKPSRRIKSILKVKNSGESVEKFEKYREKVKKKARELDEMHPRSIVDGNEVLRFYGTTMTCYSGKPNQVSEFCNDLRCGVCRIIQSNFDAYFTGRNGVQLSKSSEDLDMSMVTTLGVRHVRRAVIICRTIIGRIVNEVHGEFDNFDSVGSRLFSNLGHLVVPSPDAVLPCFVVVFD